MKAVLVRRFPDMRKSRSVFGVCPLVLLIRIVLDEDEYGMVVELYLHGKTPHSEGKKTLSYCHFVHYKSRGDWPDVESGPPR